jgi:hypothetical protein
MKNSNYTIGNRSRDRPVCSAVPQPLRHQQRAPENRTYNQYSDTKVMHLLFNLLRIKGLYMFRALLAHLQEELNEQHFVYCVRVMSGGCTSSTPILVHPTDITRTQYTKCRLCSAS